MKLKLESRLKGAIKKNRRRKPVRKPVLRSRNVPGKRSDARKKRGRERKRLKS